MKILFKGKGKKHQNNGHNRMLCSPGIETGYWNGWSFGSGEVTCRNCQHVKRNLENNPNCRSGKLEKVTQKKEIIPFLVGEGWFVLELTGAKFKVYMSCYRLHFAKPPAIYKDGMTTEEFLKAQKQGSEKGTLTKFAPDLWAFRVYNGEKQLLFVEAKREDGKGELSEGQEYFIELTQGGKLMGGKIIVPDGFEDFMRIYKEQRY